MNWLREGWGVFALALSLVLVFARLTIAPALSWWVVLAPAGLVLIGMVGAFAWLVLFAEIPGAEPPVRIRWWWAVLALLVLALILFALADPATVFELVPECEP